MLLGRTACGPAGAFRPAAVSAASRGRGGFVYLFSFAFGVGFGRRAVAVVSFILVTRSVLGRGRPVYFNAAKKGKKTVIIS